MYLSTGPGWEKHAEGGEQDPQDHHDLQTAGGAVCCPGDHDCPGLLWFQVTFLVNTVMSIHSYFTFWQIAAYFKWIHTIIFICLYMIYSRPTLTQVNGGPSCFCVFLYESPQNHHIIKYILFLMRFGWPKLKHPWTSGLNLKKKKKQKSKKRKNVKLIFIYIVISKIFCFKAASKRKKRKIIMSVFIIS